MKQFTPTLFITLIALSCLFFAQAESVEITLSDNLDGILNSYCLDIAGGNQNVDPANGLQAHTCYSYRGELGSDQVFDTEQFENNLLYMSEYDVCVELASLEAGSEVGLATCDSENELQSIVFTEEGKISPVSAPEMCFTAAEASRMGRGSQHQIKDLTLEACSDELLAFQQWGARMDLETPYEEAVSEEESSEENTSE